MSARKGLGFLLVDRAASEAPPDTGSTWKFTVLPLPNFAPHSIHRVVFCQSHVTFKLIFNTTVKVTILKVTVIKWRIEMIHFWDLKIKRRDRERGFLGIRDPRGSGTGD